MYEHELSVDTIGQAMNVAYLRPVMFVTTW